MPGRVGLVAGMFFGFSFGLGGLGAAALGELADLDQHRDGLPGHALPAVAGALDGFLPRRPGEPKNISLRGALTSLYGLQAMR